MKKLFFTLITLLLSYSVAFADQTFISESAVLGDVYYSVPINVTIQESNDPTDFYVSVGSGTLWEQFTTEYDWGDFNPATTVEWTPEELYDGVYLGIHAGVRNSGTFPVLPTDLSDVAITVQTGSITITGPEEVWYDDIFYYSWKLDESTLPDRLIFQYDSGSGWETIDTLSIKEISEITLHNEFTHDDYRVRLTYLGDAYGYTLTEWESEFVPYSFEITNRDEIEETIYDDDEVVTIEYTKERLSEFTYVTARIDGVIVDSIGTNKFSTTITTPSKEEEATTVVEFYDEEGEFITDIEIYSEHKYFEISPLTDEEYSVDEVIPFYWSYSDHFELVSACVERNSSTICEVLNSDWELDRSYNYSVVESDTTLQFYFEVTDGYTTIKQTTRLVTVGGHCREAELQATIGELEREITELRGTISILRAKVDSLEIFISEIEPDYLFVTLIKDVPNDIEKEYTSKYSNLPTLQIIDGKADMTIDNLTHVYIVDTIGRTYDAIWDDRYLYTDELQENSYFVVAIDATGDVYTFKFVK